METDNRHFAIIPIKASFQSRKKKNNKGHFENLIDWEVL